MPTPSITKRLFAHITNDAFLRGSDLEGMELKVTINYLKQYIQQLYTTQPSSDPTKILALMEAWSQLAADEETLLMARSEQNPVSLKGLSQQVQDRVQRLDQQFPYFFLPGGWRSKTKNGHAMVYKLQKNSSGHLLFSIYNAGSGLEHHEKLSNKDGTLYHPVLTYKVPADKLMTDDFKDWIEELLSAMVPSLHNYGNIGPDYLYKIIFPKLNYLNAEPIRNPDEQNLFTVGQLSGTCAQRCLQQMLKSQFKNVDGYRRFIFRFKVHAFNDYIQSNQLDDLTCHGLIQNALSHLYSLLNLKSAIDTSKDLFTEEEKANHSVKFEAASKALLAIQSRSARPETSRSNVLMYCDLMAARIEHPHPQRVEVTRVAHYHAEPLQPPYLLSEGGNLLTNLQDLLIKCKSLDNQRQYHPLFNTLENLFLTLPLPTNHITSSFVPFYNQIVTMKHVFQFFRLMNELQVLYFKSCDELIGKNSVLPRMYVTKLSIIAITTHFNTRFPLTRYQPLYELIQPTLHGLLPGSPDSVYLATNHSALDERCQHIRRLYRDCVLAPKPIPLSLIDYYKQLIHDEPALESELDTLYTAKYQNDQSEFHLQVRRYRGCALYYFTKHIDELRETTQFASLARKFDLEREIECLYAHFTGRFSKQEEYGNKNVKPKLFLKPADADNPKETLRFSYPFCTYRPLLIKTAVKETKYKMGATAPEYALDRDNDPEYWCPAPKRPDNQIQTIPFVLSAITDPSNQNQGIEEQQKEQISNYVITPKDLEARELFYLRSVPTTQLSLTLEYFTQYLDKLIRPDLQMYVEANLFQPGLLLDKLKEWDSDKFLQPFDDFIKKGLKYFEKRGEFTQHSLFFIRLACLLNQYAAELNPTRYGERLFLFCKELEGYLGCNQNDAIKASLHAYRFSAFMTLHQLVAKKVSPLCFPLNDLLTSYFYIQAKQNQHERLDTDSKFQRQAEHYYFKQFLYSTKPLIEPSILLGILRNMGISILDKSDIRITGTYPIWEVKVRTELLYTINVEQGLVFKGDMAYAPPPLEYLHTPDHQAIWHPKPQFVL